MYGKIEFINYIFIGVAISVAFMDLIWGKIFNWFTVPLALFGFMTSSYFLGWNGALQAFLGLLAGLLLYGWMFGLRILGGGDVKLLMALGAWGGLRYTGEVAFLALFIGGAMAFLILVFSGRVIDFIRRMYFFLLSLTVRELEVQLPKVDKKLKMPFGIPIAIAAVWVAYGHPLENWGMRVWPLN